MKAYKVVRKLRNGDRVSLCIPKDSGLRETYMTHGKIRTVPQGMVFDDKTTAISYKCQNNDEEVWECKVSKMVKCDKAIYMSCLHSVKSFKNLMHEVFKNAPLWTFTLNGRHFDIGETPIGTYFANDIVLEKRVG